MRFRPRLIRAALIAPRDRARLLARYPAFAADDAAAFRRDLRVPYEEYVATVSTPGMAASLELSCFLAALCARTAPRRLADLGSGFTSFVLRRYAAAAEPPVTVHSVDDDAAWLEKTRAFLAHHRLATDHLHTWDGFRAAEHEPFDLVVHDLGTLETRAASMPMALGLARQGGLVVLDDMHKRKVEEAARREARAQGCTLLSLRTFTLDSLRRFSSLAIRDRGAGAGVR
ncbi:MAG: O-methyltransferase [Planctomycetota bacterium]|jgi:predicted O-methyltransferase YrrM